MYRMMNPAASISAMQQVDLSNQINIAAVKKGREAAEQQGEAVNQMLADAADAARRMGRTDHAQAAASGRVDVTA